MIVRRYLKFQSSLQRDALDQLSEDDPTGEGPTESEDKKNSEYELEKKVNLHDLRLDSVCVELLKSGATRVIDLGCGEGKLLRRLIKQWQFKEIVGTDVSVRSLEIANKRLRLDELPSFQSERVRLFHGSLMYRDSRFNDFEAAAIVEVIEHLDPPRLSAFERVVFRHARPTTVIVTTPNSEYNVMWPTLRLANFDMPIIDLSGLARSFNNGPIRSAIGLGTQLSVIPSAQLTFHWCTFADGNLQDHVGEFDCRETNEGSSDRIDVNRSIAD